MHRNNGGQNLENLEIAPTCSLLNSSLSAATSDYSSLAIGKPVAMLDYESLTVKLPTLADWKIAKPNLLIGDLLVGCGVTLAVAPFMTIIDKAIVQRAAGSHTILQSSMASVKQILRNPINYFRSPTFLMMWGVYASTYTAANAFKTLYEYNDETESKHVRNPTNKSSTQMGAFVGTTIVNSSTTMLKDRAYAQMFGTSVATKVPLITYGLWMTRDCLVIYSSFILPEIMSNKLQNDFKFKKNDALTLSQFICPVATQFIVGPIQLLGLDFYNRPMKNVSFFDAAQKRAALLAQNYFSVVGARVARIAPAYGIGGIGNTYFRNEWRNYVKKSKLHV